MVVRPLVGRAPTNHREYAGYGHEGRPVSAADKAPDLHAVISDHRGGAQTNKNITDKTSPPRTITAKSPPLTPAQPLITQHRDSLRLGGSGTLWRLATDAYRLPIER